MSQVDSFALMPYIDSLTPELPFQSESQTSRDAAVKAARFIGKQGREVEAWLLDRGELGGTQKEACDALHITRWSMCARMRALELTGKVVKTARRREDCAVYVVIR